MSVYLLDYGAGNVRSIVNAIQHLGFELKWIESAEDFEKADKIIFPGVGAFGSAIKKLEETGFKEPLRKYLLANKPFMGICIGMQCLFSGSDESPDSQGLGIIDRKIVKFTKTKAVPHIGWNHATGDDAFYYFVHSYAAIYDDIPDWQYSLTTYHDQTFVSSIQRGNVFATQFHPEKSGHAGLKLIDSFLRGVHTGIPRPVGKPKDMLSRRIIACLDVRSNDQGDLVVTKGDQYDVREKTGDSNVRNLGKPVELARRYFEEGADEVTFLNITSFRDSPLKDTPMLRVLEEASKSVFVPLTIGGGIRDLVEPDGTKIPALEVAGQYFRSGADKVSIGSDAVYCAEAFHKGDRSPNCISEISRVYGCQAVVISVDPKRVYVKDAAEANGHHVVETSRPGPEGQTLCWYQCTVKGGREMRDLDVIQLVTACEQMGAGEILLNCMDQDGTNAGYDLELIASVKKHVTIPVIASSGAGKPEHFSELFAKTNVEAGLAAGIFHRREVPIQSVKDHLIQSGYTIRNE
ncbi:hypothetical protein EDD86DRAFT_206570 [Gorgonomyces haynaldii]|nr:hypothetical protein EDD86DRAFT_206570 [Gorgonomyces haynaldii]